MIIEDGLSIKTTSACQRRCKNCTVIPWMDAYPDYHLPLEEIDSLIKMSQKHNLKWKYILLSGGEPLLWKNVVGGTRKLYESGITDDLKFLTNGMFVISPVLLDKVGDILKYVHHFRVSRYNNNGNHIELLKMKYGSRIEVEDRTVHMVAPEHPIKDSLPADCRCRAYSMFGCFIDSCGPARTIYHKLQISIEGWTYGIVDYSCSIDDFFNYFIVEGRAIHRFDIMECQFCIANAKVQKFLKKVEA